MWASIEARRSDERSNGSVLNPEDAPSGFLADLTLKIFSVSLDISQHETMLGLLGIDVGEAAADE